MLEERCRCWSDQSSETNKSRFRNQKLHGRILLNLECGFPGYRERPDPVILVREQPTERTLLKQPVLPRRPATGKISTRKPLWLVNSTANLARSLQRTNLQAKITHRDSYNRGKRSTARYMNCGKSPSIFSDTFKIRQRALTGILQRDPSSRRM